jgi:hypothetical protein
LNASFQKENGNYSSLGFDSSKVQFNLSKYRNGETKQNYTFSVSHFLFPYFRSTSRLLAGYILLLPFYKVHPENFKQKIENVVGVGI